MEAPEPDEDLEGTPDEGFIFVLEKATLETAKVGKGYQILNCDDHANFLRRHGKDPANYRPDICLLYTSPSPRDGLLSRMPSSA